MKGAKISLCRENRLRERRFAFKEESNLFSKGAKKENNNKQYHGVYPRGSGKRKSSYDDEALAPGRKGDPQLYVVGKISKWTMPKIRIRREGIKVRLLTKVENLAQNILTKISTLV